MSNSKQNADANKQAQVNGGLPRRVAYTCNPKLAQRLYQAQKIKGLSDAEISKIALDEYLTRLGL